MTNAAKVSFAIITCVALFAHLSSIWRLETYPFTDLPNHLSEAYLFRVLSQPNEPLRSVYRSEVTLFTPGTLHTVFCAQFQDVELGNRVFYTMYMAILLLGMLLLVLSARGDPWIALLTMLWFYNFNTMWGFTAYTMGLSLLLVASFAVLKFNQKPTLLRALSIACLMLLLYYCHILVFFFALVAFIVIIRFQRGFTNNHLLGFIALTPGVIASLIWVHHSSSFSSSTPAFLLDYYRYEYLSSLLTRLYKMLCIDNPISAGRTGEVFSMALCVPLLAALIGGLLWYKSDEMEESATRKARDAAQLFVIVGAICYLFAPDRLPGWLFFYERFSVIFLLSAIWVTSFVVPRRLLPVARVSVAVMIIVHSACWYQYFGQFHEVAKPFRTLLYKNPDAMGHSLAAIITDRGFRGTPAFIHYQNYQLIWNGGAVPTKLLEYRFHLFEKSNPYVLPEYFEWVSEKTWTQWLVGRYKKMDLLLCRGSPAMSNSITQQGYDLLRRDDGWTLFRRK